MAVLVLWGALADAYMVVALRRHVARRQAEADQRHEEWRRRARREWRRELRAERAALARRTAPGV